MNPIMMIAHIKFEDVETFLEYSIIIKTVIGRKITDPNFSFAVTRMIIAQIRIRPIHAPDPNSNSVKNSTNSPATIQSSP